MHGVDIVEALVQRYENTGIFPYFVGFLNLSIYVLIMRLKG